MLDMTMTLPPDCPTPEELSSFHDGRLDHPRCDAVATHVSACDTLSLHR